VPHILPTQPNPNHRESDELHRKLHPGDDSSYSGSSWQHSHSLSGRSPVGYAAANRAAGSVTPLSSSPAATLVGFERPSSSGGGLPPPRAAPAPPSDLPAAALGARPRGGVASLLAASGAAAGVAGAAGGWSSGAASPAGGAPRPRLAGAAVASSRQAPAPPQTGDAALAALGGSISVSNLAAGAATHCTCGSRGKQAVGGGSASVGSSGGSFTGSIMSGSGGGCDGVSGSSGDEREEIARVMQRGSSGGGSSSSSAGLDAAAIPYHRLCSYCQHLALLGGGAALAGWGDDEDGNSNSSVELRDYSALPDSVWLAILGGRGLGVRDLCYAARANRGLRALALNTPTLWSNIYWVGGAGDSGVPR